jgi:hypothetical protein
MQDLFKPSFQPEEDSPTPALGTPPGEGSPTPMLGTLLGEGGLAPALEANPETSAGPIGQDQEPGVEIASITGSPSPDADWQKAISEYLRLKTILDDEIKTRCLVCC